MTHKPRYARTLTLLAALALSSCAEAPAPAEIGLSPWSDVATKGYVTGTALAEVPSSQLPSGDAVPRTLSLTAWHYGPTGREVEYLSSRTFAAGADGLWHADPAAYWPDGGRMDFLAYSASQPFAADAVSWGAGCSTDRLVLDVGREHTQDDILYSCRLSLRRADDGAGVHMQFSHAQAWVEVQLSSTAAAAGAVTLRGVVFRDVYTSGRLTVTHPFGFAEGAWSFVGDVREDTEMDDVRGAVGAALTEDPRTLDWLLPEQPMCDMVIRYSLPGSDVVFEHEYVMPVTHWLAGHRYVYSVVFSPAEVTVTADVTAWTPAAGGTWRP